MVNRVVNSGLGARDGERMPGAWAKALRRGGKEMAEGNDDLRRLMTTFSAPPSESFKRNQSVARIWAAENDDPMTTQ